LEALKNETVRESNSAKLLKYFLHERLLTLRTHSSIGCSHLKQSESMRSQIRGDFPHIEFGSDQEAQIVGCSLTNATCVDADAGLPEVGAETDD
jgi:hypothetical protein